MSRVYLGTFDLPANLLTPYPGNPRQGDLDMIRQSVRAHGQYRSVVARPTNPDNPAAGGVILAGNHTVRAIIAEHHDAHGPGTWPTVRVEMHDVDDQTAAKIVAVDNRAADLGEYDDRALAELLAGLDDLDATGYTADDLSDLVASLADPVAELLPDAGPPADTAPTGPPTEPVTAPGDLWQLGEHRLICGDSRDHGTIATLLEGAGIALAFTSPPYASQRKYDASSGFTPIPPDEYVDWFEDVQANVRAHLNADGSWFVNIRAHSHDGQRHLYVHDLVAAHVRQWGWRFVDDFCWVDTRNGVPGAWPNRFKDAWEPLFHFSLNKEIVFHPLANATHSGMSFSYDSASAESHSARTGSGLMTSGTWKQETDGLARPSNVVQLPTASGEAGGLHSAPFPVSLPAFFIRAFTNPGDIVFDPFGGSGTTLIAAANEGRIGYQAEISAAYCDVICRRYQQHTGTMPVRHGQPHDFT